MSEHDAQAEAQQEAEAAATEDTEAETPAKQYERIHELAKGEAEPDEEAAEAEEAEAETPPAPEPEPPSPEDAERTAELERAYKNYAKRVEKAFAPAESPPPCEHCMGLGFDLTYGAGKPDLLDAADKDTCDQCDGWGMVKTGSKVEGQDVKPCERCKGAGYLTMRPVPVVNAEQVAPVVVALQDGTANGDEATALQEGDPGWEPWMGTPAGASG